MFKAKLLNEFYGKYDKDAVLAGFSKGALKAFQKFTDENIDTEIEILGQYTHILGYICAFTRGIPHYFDLFEFLVNNGININYTHNVMYQTTGTREVDNATIFDTAMFNKKNDLVYFILHNDKFVKSPDILTAYASNIYRYSDVLLMLYEAGASLKNNAGDIKYLSDTDKSTAMRLLDIIVTNTHLEIEKTNILIQLKRSKDLTIIIDVVKKYPQINILDEDGDGSNVLGCIFDWYDGRFISDVKAKQIIKVIDVLSSIDAKIFEFKKKYILHTNLALNPRIFEYLVKTKDIKTDIITTYGTTIHDYVTIMDDIDAGLKLCNHKHINHQDANGNTPLIRMIGKCDGWQNMFTTLIKYGADANIKNNKGETAASLRKEYFNKYHL